MTINELKEKRMKLWEGAKAFLDSHRNESGILSAEDDETYTKMEADINALGKEISRLERQAEIDARLKEPSTEPLTGKPEGAVKVKTGRASDEYKSALMDAFRTNFKRISNVLQESVDADGGYLVPIEMDTRLIDILNEENVMRKLSTVITTSGERRINIAASRPAALWIEEGGELTWGDATFGQILLDAHKLHVAIKVTEELLYDSAFNLENYITEQFGMALANAEEDAFLNGDGDGKPTGIFDAAGGGNVADMLSSDVQADDLINLVYALKRPYRKKASFIMNDATIATVRKLKDGNGAYIWQPSYQIGEPDKILGYNVYTSAYAPNGSIAFGDYSYYNIGDRGTRSFSELRELFAGNGMIGFVAKERVDGKLILPEAVQILTLSEDETTGE